NGIYQCPREAVSHESWFLRGIDLSTSPENCFKPNACPDDALRSQLPYGRLFGEVKVHLRSAILTCPETRKQGPKNLRMPASFLEMWQTRVLIGGTYPRSLRDS